MSDLWKRTNNPGNIRSIKTKGGFRAFGSLAEGMQAWRSLLNRRYFGKGLNTPKSILYTYAPPVENDTSGYVDFVSKKMGITPDTVLDPSNEDQMANLASAMFKMETGHTFTPEEIKAAWKEQVTPTNLPAIVPNSQPVATAPTEEVMQVPSLPVDVYNLMGQQGIVPGSTPQKNLLDPMALLSWKLSNNPYSTRQNPLAQSIF